MKKTQIWSWYISGFFKKHRRLVFLSLILGILLSFGIIWLLPLLPKPVKTTRIGIVGNFSKTQLPISIKEKISDGLTASASDGSIVPYLASDWDVSSDGTEYTFYLRDNIFWQDNTEINTGDLDYKFTDVDVIKKDEKTIIFKLKSGKSFAPFPLLLSQPIFKKNLIGTGEWRMVKTIEKNGVLKEMKLEKSMENAIYKIYPTINMAKTAFMIGEIDEIQDISQNVFEYEKDWETVIDLQSEKKENTQVALFFNLENELFKDNKALRQALAYATRKPKDENRATGPIIKNNWAYNSDVKLYEFEPKRALELAEKSLGNIDKVRSLELKIATTNSLQYLAEEIKRDWQEVFGCKVDVEVINAIDPNYQILLTSQEVPVDPDQYSLWHSTQQWPQNITYLKNFRIDKLLEEGRTEIDNKTRREIYLEFQKYFVEEVPAIYLYYPDNYRISRKNIIKNKIQVAIRSILKTETN